MRSCGVHAAKSSSSTKSGEGERDGNNGSAGVDGFIHTRPMMLAVRDYLFSLLVARAGAGAVGVVTAATLCSVAALVLMRCRRGKNGVT